MSFLERTPVEPSDAELITRVRGGDKGAYGELFARHRQAAERLARSLARGSDADDLVSEAFAKVFNVLLGGGGPDLAFRAYLLTSVRRLNVDRARSTTRSTPTDDIETLDSGVPFVDPAVAGFESSAAAKAFESLPERWQMVLWHLEVEGQKPSDIAPLLGMSPNSVSVLAYRAREGLRQAFLQMHAADVVDDRCEWTRSKLGAYVRKASSRRESEKIETHLRECRPCTAVYLELTEVNSSLAALLGPLVLGAAAAAYLGGGAAVGGAAGLTGLLGRAVDFVTANTQAAVVSGTVATLAVAGAVGVAMVRPDPAAPVRDNVAILPPRPSTTPAPAPKQVKKKSTPPPVVAPPVVTADPPPIAPPAPGPSKVPAKPSAPTSTTDSDPTSAPTPSTTPSETPTATPTPTPVVDASVAVTVQRTWLALLLNHRHTAFSATVAGVPAGTTTSLRLTLSQPLLILGQWLPGNCTIVSSHEITCTAVSDGALTFAVRTRTRQPLTITATLATVAGDTDSGNDSSSATAGSA